MRRIDCIVIHSAATPNGDQHFTTEDIRRWHVEERQWADIGYHHIIEIDGTVKPGRDEETVGAHVAGHNSHSIGVCLIGTDAFTCEQWVSLAELVRSLLTKYQGAKVCGHRDFPNVHKICPGFDVSAWQRGRYAAGEICEVKA